MVPVLQIQEWETLRSKCMVGETGTGGVANQHFGGPVMMDNGMAWRVSNGCRTHSVETWQTSGSARWPAGSTKGAGMVASARTAAFSTADDSRQVVAMPSSKRAAPGRMERPPTWHNNITFHCTICDYAALKSLIHYRACTMHFRDCQLPDASTGLWRSD